MLRENVCEVIGNIWSVGLVRCVCVREREKPAGCHYLVKSFLVDEQRLRERTYVSVCADASAGAHN